MHASHQLPTPRAAFREVPVHGPASTPAGKWSFIHLHPLTCLLNFNVTAEHGESEEPTVPE